MQSNNGMMDRRDAIGALGVTTALAATTPAAFAAGTAIRATVNAANMMDVITPHMWGGFLEHIDNLINYGLWAEAIDDRKFYFGVGPVPPPKPPGQGNARNSTAGIRWNPIGTASAITADRTAPYAGDQSPVVALGAEPRGMRQTGVPLASDKGGYTGRIVIAGTAGARVTATLIWGPGAGDRQSVNVPVTADWSKQPLRFDVRGDTNDGVLEIAGSGSGQFKVGAVSLMPADNVEGFRKDSIALMKSMNCGILRLPGGNWLSDYDWQDAVGDSDRRPPVYDYYWNGLQPNDVGQDELIALCRLTGAEPYITVNAGFGDARSARNQVEYTNGAATTPFGRMRAENGHPEPYNVKLWNIGNEAYGFWQWGAMARNQYTFKHNQFAKAMRKVDPGITLIASGAMPDEMTVTSNARRMTGKVEAELGGPADWTGGMIERCWGNFDLIAEHAYTTPGQRFDLVHGQNDPLPIQDLPTARLGGRNTGYVDVKEPLIDTIRRQSNRTRAKSEWWAEYKKHYPQLAASKVYISFDEWSGGGGPGMRGNLSIAMNLQELFRHTDFVKKSAFTMGLTWVSYDRTHAVLSGQGTVFQLYHDHFGTIPVEVTGNSPQPAPKWPVGGDQPRVNAGSATYPLDVSAALTDDRKTLTVAVINATETAQTLNLNVQNFGHGRRGRLWRLTGASLDAVNMPGQKPQVTVAEAAFDANAPELSVPPYSITVHAFPVA